MAVTSSLYLDTYHPKKDGKCSLSVRVTFNRVRRYYPIPFLLTPDEFKKINGLKTRKEFTDVKIRISQYLSKAQSIISNMKVFSWTQFEKSYLEDRSNKLNVSEAFDNYIFQLTQAGRLGTASSYTCAKVSFAKYFPYASFADLTPYVLNKYKAEMLEEGKSPTTVGIYLRSMRTIVNIAIQEGVFPKDNYPFGKRKCEIPTGNGIKKSLTLSDIEKIYTYNPPDKWSLQLAKDFWLLIYFCNGINVKDLCMLKNQNIEGDILQFVRAKTERTKTVVEPIRLVLLEEAKEIIERRRSLNRGPDDYLFPILEKDMEPIIERKLIKQFNSVINDNMAKIAKELKIGSSLTTYVARHSYASIMLRSGASTEFIKEALGHGNVQTTQKYLAGFEDSAKRDLGKALVNFKSKKKTNGKEHRV